MTLCKTGRFKTKSEWLLLINSQVPETGDGPTLFELLKCN